MNKITKFVLGVFVSITLYFVSFGLFLWFVCKYVEGYSGISYGLISMFIGGYLASLLDRVIKGDSR